MNRKKKRIWKEIAYWERKWEIESDFAEDSHYRKLRSDGEANTPEEWKDEKQRKEEGR